MARRINLGRQGFLGWLLNVLLRDPVHDFGGSHAYMPHATWLHGGGVMDITSFKQMLIKIISNSCDQNDPTCIQDVNENIDSSLLLKAYNSVIDEIIYDKIIYAFFIDLHGEEGDNTEFIDKTTYMRRYMQNSDDLPEIDEELKSQVKPQMEQKGVFIPTEQEMGEEDVVDSKDVVESKEMEEEPMPVLSDNQMGDDQMGDDQMGDDDFGGGEPPAKKRDPLTIQKGPPYHVVAPGTVTYLIEILTLKKDESKLRPDDAEMLRLLEDYTNYNYLTNFNKKREILLKTLVKINNISYSKMIYTIQNKPITNYTDDYNAFYIFYNDIIMNDIPLQIKDVLDDFITTFKNFELFSYVIFSNQIKNDITIKINAPIKPEPTGPLPLKVNRTDKTKSDRRILIPNLRRTVTADGDGMVYGVPGGPVVGQPTPVLGKRREIPSNGGNNVKDKGGPQPASKYNLYVNTVRKIIGGYSNIQRGGTHSANWLKMLKCFAFNFMGMRHNMGVLLAQAAPVAAQAAPVAATATAANYHRYHNVPVDNLNAYDLMTWFDFEKSSLSLKYSNAHINDDVIKYIVGKFSAQNFTNTHLVNGVPTIDDLTQVRVGASLPTPANVISKQQQKYIKSASNSINNIKFPIYDTSVLNGDLFKLLANTFINTNPFPLPANFDRYNMKYIINNECNLLEKKDAHNNDPFTNNAAPNVLTNYPSYVDPGPSGSAQNIIVDEFGEYHMGFCGNNDDDSYTLHLVPSDETHDLIIRNTSGPGPGSIPGNATYNFSRLPDSFGIDNWNQVTANLSISCAVEFLERYMNFARTRSQPNGKVPITWKNLAFLCNDFGKFNQNVSTSRENRNYPRIPNDIVFSDSINNAAFQNITGPWRRLPAFFIFYTFMLFKGTGDISQEMTSLIKFGGILPLAGAVLGPNTPQRSTVDILSDIKFDIATSQNSTANPYYVKFDNNGNAPRLLLSHDRPSGARFILTMHNGISYLLNAQNNAQNNALINRQNNINTFAFGGYIGGDMRNIIFSKVNNPLYFGAAGNPALAMLSTKPPIPLTLIQTDAAAATGAVGPPVVAPLYTYGGKKSRKHSNRTLTKRKHHNRTLTKRKHHNRTLTKRKHSNRTLTKRKYHNRTLTKRKYHNRTLTKRKYHNRTLTKRKHKRTTKKRN
jgi:hypothetical protein